MQTKLQRKGMTGFCIEHVGFKSKAIAAPDSKVALFTLRLVLGVKSHNAAVSNVVALARCRTPRTSSSSRASHRPSC